MSYTQSFTVSFNITTPSIVTLTDNSTGTDTNITSRTVTIQTYDGSFLTPTGNVGNTILWSLASGNTIAIDCLDKDYAVLITVNWIGGSSILYTKTIAIEFNSYARIYRYSLLKAQASNPLLINNKNFFSVESNLTTFIDGAVEAVVIASDITLAQLCNTNAKVYIDNPQLAY